MRKIGLFFYYLLIMFFVGYLFINRDLEIIVNNSVYMFMNNIFPFLFPMIVVSHLLVDFNLPYYLNKYTSKVTYGLLKLSGVSTYVFFVSLISGTPTNAIICKKMLENKSISRQCATSLLSFSLFLNPLFLFVTLKSIFDYKTTLLLILNNYLCSIILGFIIRNYNDDTDSEIELINSKFSNSLVEGIKSSVNVLTMIFGTIVFFNIIRFNLSNDFLNIINGVLEVSYGLVNLGDVDFSYNFKVIAASMFISFCGLCIHLQIKSIITDTGIYYKVFLKNRFIHLLLTLVGAVIILSL